MPCETGCKWTVSTLEQQKEPIQWAVSVEHRPPKLETKTKRG